MKAISDITQRDDIRALFGSWEETIIYSCLDETMGKIYAGSEIPARSAAAVLGDFRFVAGTPSDALLKDLQALCPCGFAILVPQNAEWASVIESVYGSRARKVTRYATKKDPDTFDIEALYGTVAEIPPGYELRMIDSELYESCKATPPFCDLVSNFGDYAAFARLGLGVVALFGGEVVSGASSYSSYSGGIEIEVDTREDFRRRGLAYFCAAKLICECRRRSLYPSWDAQNKISLALAEKLGYRFSHEYTAYEIQTAL